MSITDQIKILDKSFLQNKSQYDLDKKATIITAWSSKNLDKVEYLTDKDLGLKPNTIEQARFEYSPLVKIFKKGLNEDGKEEGLLKRLKNIEDKDEDQSKKQLDAIKNINISSKSLEEISFFSTLSDEAKNLMIDFKEIDDCLDKAQLICTKTDGKTKYDFSKFTVSKKFASRICNQDFTLQEVKDDQIKLKILISNSPQKLEKVKEKEDTLKSPKKLFSIREKIIRAFKRGTFPYIDGIKVDKESDEESDEKNQMRRIRRKQNF